MSESFLFIKKPPMRETPSLQSGEERTAAVLTAYRL